VVRIIDNFIVTVSQQLTVFRQFRRVEVTSPTPTQERISTLAVSRRNESTPRW